MRNHLKAVSAATAIFLGAGLARPYLHAQPVRDKILDEVYMTLENDRPAIHVSLTFPFHYLSHFPPDKGDELRIRLKPVRVPTSDSDAVFTREGIRPDRADTVGLLEVLYEGDIDGGPYITLIFSRTVNYGVIPGTDYRHLTVVVEPPQ
jgi:hypothetical protein